MNIFTTAPLFGVGYVDGVYTKRFFLRSNSSTTRVYMTRCQIRVHFGGNEIQKIGPFLSAFFGQMKFLGP